MKHCSFKLGILPAFLLLAGCFEPGKPVPVQQDKPMQFHVRAFGVEPSSTNVYAALKSAVEAAQATGRSAEILFEPGAVYRIALPDGPNMQGKYALHIQNATNLVLNGQGATLLVTHPEIGAICTEDSSGVEIKNFNIDYDPLPYAQGTITAINLSENWFELKVDDGFMEPDQPCFDRAMSAWGITVRDMSGGRRRYGPAAVFSERWEKTAERTWRMHTPHKTDGFNPSLKQAGLEPGDRYVHMARNYAQAVAAKNCDRVLWENITIFASPGLAFFPHLTSHHTIRNCHVQVKDGRIFSTNADGIHMRGSRGHMLVEGCSFEGMADDGINVHSSAMSVQGSPAPNQVLVKKHTYSVRPGDELELVHSASAAVDGQYSVKAVQDAGANWLVTLDRALPELTAGSGFSETDNFYNLSESADPFVIRNCRFGAYRGRGVLVSAHGGLIENNVFDLNEGWGVVMNYESTRWAEGPIAYDVTIRDNEFHGRGAYSAAILAHIETRKGMSVEGYPIHDIRIEGNRFFDYGTPAVELHNTRDVQILSNQVVCSDDAPRGRKEYAAVELMDCADVVVDRLDVKDRDPRQIAVVKIGADCPEQGMTVTNITADTAASCKMVQDLRTK
ncbi:MAG: right-handed parallel beta-helix repeat-containing protein [Kiritimatiellales bacterium]|nr:right-handed parallel beta-helix repeat-containing protein [Kiritimatiellales bacterium]